MRNEGHHSMTEPTISLRPCPQCGSLVGLDEVICPNCGSPLTKDSAELAQEVAPATVPVAPDSAAAVPSEDPAPVQAVSFDNWVEYFQLLNGRLPNQDEYQQAVADGTVIGADAAQAAGQQAAANQAIGQQPAGTPAVNQQPAAAPTQNQQPAAALAAPAQSAGDGAFVALWKGYWGHSRHVWTHPTSVDASIRDAYAWITYGIIVVSAVTGVTLLWSSAGVFFTAVILLVGLPLLLTLIGSGLVKGLLNIQCSFMDMLKIGTQSVLPLAPLSWVFVLNSAFISSAFNENLRAADSNIGYLFDVYEDYLVGLLDDLSTFGIVMLLLAVAFAVVMIMSGVIQGIYFYRIALSTQGVHIDHYPWYVTIITVVVTLMGSFTLWRLVNTVIDELMKR